MQMQAASVTLPGELLAEISATVGPTDLTTFIVEMMKAELGRRKRYQGLAWNGQEQSEAGEPRPGTSAWMKGIREEGEARLTLRHF